MAALLAVLFGNSACSSDDAITGRIYPVIRDTTATNPSGPTDPEEYGDTPETVQYKTFKGLVMCGYLAWFNCVGDWTNRGWVHLGSNGGGFKPGATCVDFWPDMTEYTKTYNTPLYLPDGSKAQMFSSADKETIDLHFKWMKQYGIDGAIIQRFKSAVESNPSSKQVIGYCLEAAKKYGRAVMIEYDLSGLSASSDENVIINDWNELNSTYKISDPTVNPTYVWTNGKPLVGFYGIDHKDRGGTPAQYINMFDKMVGRDGKAGCCSFLAGTGYTWRTSGNDAGTLADWQQVLERCAVISPWAVGRYSSRSAFTAKESDIRQDLKWCNDRKIIYAPVAFPGFSWRNTKTTWTDNGTKCTLPDNAPYDQIPREKGDFLWTQLSRYVQWGAPSIFIAMFDEMDEGTCIFKCAHKAQTPLNSSTANPNGKILSYDDDVPTGYYLFLTGSAAKWIKGATGYTQKRPDYVEPK